MLDGLRQGLVRTTRRLASSKRPGLASPARRPFDRATPSDGESEALVTASKTSAVVALILLCLSGAAAPPATAQDSSTAAMNELDAFMQRVLARREINRQTLQQYILNDLERIEVLGPSRTPLFRTSRDYTWYV